MPHAILLVLGAIAACMMPAFANAQLRTIPPDTERGYIQHVEQSLVTMDGKTMRLAPGSTIRNTQNLIIVPTALPPEGAVAEYLVDRDGQIARVWLLTPAEESREKRKPKH